MGYYFAFSRWRLSCLKYEMCVLLRINVSCLLLCADIRAKKSCGPAHFTNSGHCRKSEE